MSVLKWLNAKGDISLTDRLGGTPLHDAAEQGQFEVGTVELRNMQTIMCTCNSCQLKSVHVYAYLVVCIYASKVCVS